MTWDFLTTHLGLLYELGGAFALLTLLVVLAGTLIARFDRIPLEDAIYFALITAFTVGFGDVSPKSRGARAVTVLLAFAGIVVIGIVVAVSVHTLEIVLSARS